MASYFLRPDFIFSKVNKASGVDRVTKEEYQENLDSVRYPKDKESNY